MLPKDMPVHIATGGGCKHITEVDKQPRRRANDLYPSVPVLPDGRFPPALVLRAGYRAPLWFEAWADDVPYELKGRWPAKAFQ